MSEIENSRRQSPVEVSIPPHGITLLESHHADTFSMEMGNWPFDKLCWIPVGSGQLALPARSYPIGQDDLLLLLKGSNHYFIDDPADPLTLLIVCFDRAKIGSSQALLALLDDFASVVPCERPLWSNNKRSRIGIGDSFRRMLREQSTQLPGFEIVLQSELANVLVEILRSCSDKRPVATNSAQAITDSLQYLEQYYYKPIVLGELASQYDLSPRRFSELFKQRTGQTLIDYVNAKRVASAQKRLQATGHIAYACLEAGFNDLGYFYRVFKKYTGQTPGGYLRMQLDSTDQEDSS